MAGYSRKILESGGRIVWNHIKPEKSYKKYFENDQQNHKKGNRNEIIGRIKKKSQGH